MAIKAVVDKLDDVDEKYRDLYTEKGGKFELTGVEGMKTEADITRLTTALEKERKDHKDVKQRYSVLGERKPEDILATLDRLPELEAAAAGKLDEPAISKIVETRIASKTAPLDRQVKALTQQLAERDVVIQGFTAKETQRTMHDSIREALGKTKGFQATAVEDALMQGERMLTINEEGKVVTKDKVGVTPGVDVFVWLTEMQNKRPHWWGPTQGGGGPGNNGGGGGGGDNPWTAENWNMTQQGAIVRANQTRADQLAKSAGTSVGGPKPLPRK